MVFLSPLMNDIPTVIPVDLGTRGNVVPPLRITKQGRGSELKGERIKGRDDQRERPEGE